jgi:CheY-like chemotaxis protein
MKKTTLLLVEDDADIRMSLRLLLECEGFAVLTAADGSDALEQLARHQVDLIVTDLMMPQLDGLDLIRRVNSTPELAHLPIVVMTAYDDRFMKAAKTAGAQAVLRKPDDLEQLAETVNRLLDAATDEEAA